MKHQNSMIDFVLVCIAQWAVHDSPKRRHDQSTWTFTPSTCLFPRGKQFENSLLIDSSTCLHLVLLRPLGYFMMRFSIGFSFFCFLGALITDEPSTFVWVVSKVVTILLSLSMILIVTILSYIWCISLVVLFRNFVTLNLLLSQLFGCKLLSIFQNAQMIPICDIENGI